MKITPRSTVDPNQLMALASAYREQAALDRFLADIDSSPPVLHEYNKRAMKGILMILDDPNAPVCGPLGPGNWLDQAGRVHHDLELDAGYIGAPGEDGDGCTPADFDCGGAPEVRGNP